MSETIRSFLAIELTPLTKDKLKEIQDDFQKLDINVKWVKSENMHLTLRFLGNILPGKLEGIQKDLPGLFKGQHCFESEISTLGAFPKPERARVLWVGMEKNADKIKTIAETLEGYLNRLGFPREREVFIPHLTLGRVRSPKNIQKLSEFLKNYSFPPIAQEINTITLFKSTLTSQGPIYEALQTHKLPK